MRQSIHRGSLTYEIVNPLDTFKRSYGSTLVQRRAEPEQQRRSEAPLLDPDRQWIKIQVIDDDTGDPLPNLPLKLKLPGKGVQEYRTHANTGRVSESDLSAGTCDIISMNDDEAWEVIAVS